MFTDVQVPIQEGEDLIIVILPYVAARDEESFQVTAKLSAMISLRSQRSRMEAAKAQMVMEQRDLQISNLRKIKFDPPRVVFKCEDCGEQWDAWVDDDGALEDQWSCVCTNGQCSSHGNPAMLVPEEDW